ncbi:hypothetical protein [Caulobacter vibrioides]|uniref:Uncharacterized protein n=2 Tax=Caulobacter vibrioides TaxID=155892 RepID=Q9AC28_CAUVC|nr:hypothetical protein [Caulobacter vibrioides]YP_002515413.1 hypothetical protein CCNA_00038 [Caulobacter vibrioides NA1000]AAK22027.1 hypothetical protein CC_0039 [Caulobacter vibrioides CB15]ACL93505.1 hypothetical protein CCNA_00038 [Caulobacter vibrioides NA1000]ATC26876.1 hypothetical protein CA607_00195 [Caulobacter vibrioides]QXZ52135.1 hypothetical protein KZH45_00200 [Caulobacter vibrioides]
MRRSIVRSAVLAVAMIGATSSTAHAETRMFSYDPISADAKRLTGAGVTILFKDGLLGASRPLKVLATGVPAQAMLKPARSKDLGPGGLSAISGVDANAALYAVDTSAAQGKIYLRAFCPGSTRLWLSFSPIAVRRDLRIQAFGDDPKASGQARLCGTLDFSYRGEWRLPDNRTPDPMSDWTDNPQRPDVSN